MKVDNINKSINFKWNRATHLEMSMLALQDFNIDKGLKRQIARYSQMPDFQKSELGFFNNTHFFFPYSKKKSFGKHSEYLNAFSKYKEHLLETLLSDESNQLLKNLGYTLHYLQDMSVPLHTEAGGLIQKILKYRTHTNFEKGPIYGTTNNSQLISNYKKERINTNSLFDLFIDTAKFSQKPEYKVTRNNKKNWAKIQQDCFNRGVNASRALIETVLQSFL